jgi:hypothetical protein
MTAPEKKELKIGSKLAPVAVFTINGDYLECHNFYRAQLFKIRLQDIQIVNVEVSGMLGTKGTLQLIGGGVTLGSAAFTKPQAEQAREWIMANKQ